MQLPGLSVILPNYNHAKYLPDALEAIMRQSVPPAEVVLIDDGSTDNSMEVITRFAAKYPTIRVYQNDQNRGVVYTMNRGIGLAQSEFLLFTAADDMLLPGFLEKSMRILAEYPKAGLSSTASTWRYEDSGLSWQMAAGLSDKPSYLTPAELVQLGVRGKLMISSSSVVFRKQALIDVGSYIPELRWHTDWFACFTTAFRFGMCYLPESLSLVNILPKSYYTGRNKQQHREVLTGILERLNSPAFSDVQPRVSDSGALSLFSIPMLKIVLSRREFWPFMNLTFLRRTLWRSAELGGKRMLPRPVARLILKWLYGA
jgi:glycosyltransferase involved in cell wall biosynthesis